MSASKLLNKYKIKQQNGFTTDAEATILLDEYMKNATDNIASESMDWNSFERRYLELSDKVNSICEKNTTLSISVIEEYFLLLDEIVFLLENQLQKFSVDGTEESTVSYDENWSDKQKESQLQLYIQSSTELICNGNAFFTPINLAKLKQLENQLFGYMLAVKLLISDTKKISP